MKKMIVCESCAAEYDASLVRCPYCGSGYAPAEEEEFMDGQEAIRKDLDGQKEKGNASLQKGLGRMGRAVLIAMVVIAVLISMVMVLVFALIVKSVDVGEDVIGYVNPFSAFAVKDGNFCGSQIVPGIYKYFDTFDIAGLIAPRPCLLEMGRADACFSFEELYRGYEETRYIYQSAGVGDRIDADVHEGGHAYSGAKAPEFFKKYL